MQLSPLNDPAPVSYTLKIGVTGHRDIPDAAMITASVERLLVQMRSSLLAGMKDLHEPRNLSITRWQQYESLFSWKLKHFFAFFKIIPGHTYPDRQTEMKWEIFSSLAKGADRLVVRSAMEKLGAGLVAVLPVELMEYKKDFETAEDLAEFNELVTKSANYSSLLQCHTTSPCSIEERYEQAGKAVVDSCEILIAVWDGKPARGLGGTANIIKYACSVHRPVIWINTLNPGTNPLMIDEFPVDSGTVDNSEDIGLIVKTRQVPQFASGWSSRFLKLAEYNRDSSFRKIGYKKIFMHNRTKFEVAGKNAGMSADLLHPLLEKILPHYSRSDYLATYYQKLHIRSAIWLYRLSAIAVTVAVVQALYFPTHSALVIFEILALAIAVCWFRYSLLGQWHEKWLDYRHLAERIRILLFESLIGRQNEAEKSKNKPLPFYSGPGSWILDVIESIQSELPDMDLSRDSIPVVRCFINKGWISDQAEYHSKNAAEKESKVRKENRTIGILLTLTFAAAIFHLFGLTDNPFVENVIIAMVIVLPAFAAAQHAIGNIRDYERISVRSARMKDILQNIERRIENASGWDEIISEIRNAEDLMSAENLEWSVSLSFRRISLPV